MEGRRDNCCQSPHFPGESHCEGVFVWEMQLPLESTMSQLFSFNANLAHSKFLFCPPVFHSAVPIEIIRNRFSRPAPVEYTDLQKVTLFHGNFLGAQNHPTARDCCNCYVLKSQRMSGTKQQTRQTKVHHCSLHAKVPETSAVLVKSAASCSRLFPSHDTQFGAKEDSADARTFCFEFAFSFLPQVCLPSPVVIDFIWSGKTSAPLVWVQFVKFLVTSVLEVFGSTLQISGNLFVIQWIQHHITKRRPANWKWFKLKSLMSSETWCKYIVGVFDYCRQHLIENPLQRWTSFICVGTRRNPGCLTRIFKSCNFPATGTRRAGGCESNATETELTACHWKELCNLNATKCSFSVARSSEFLPETPFLVNWPTSCTFEAQVHTLTDTNHNLETVLNEALVTLMYER